MGESRQRVLPSTHAGLSVSQLNDAVLAVLS